MDELPESREIRITPMSFLLGAGVVLLAVFIAIIASRIVSVLVLLFLGILLAESIRPIANKLQTWKIPRGAAVLIVYLLLALALTGIGLIIIPPLVVQVRGFDRLTPQLIEWIEREVPRLYQISVDLGFDDDQLRELGTSLTSTITQLIGTLAAVPFQVLGFLFGVVSVLVIGFFWMSATERLNRSVIALLPPKRAAAVRGLAAELSLRAGGWVRGQVILMVFIGTVTFVGLFVLDVPYPVALATWASLMEIIPIIGPFLGAIPAIIVALTISPWVALATAILYVIVQQLENNILVPKIMERAVGLHPILVMVGVLAGGVLYGILGIVIAVPLMAAMQVLVMRLLVPWLIAQMGDDPAPLAEQAESDAQQSEEPSEAAAVPRESTSPPDTGVAGS